VVLVLHYIKASINFKKNKTMEDTAKTELLEFIKRHNKKIKCARITTGNDWCDQEEKRCIELKTEYTQSEYESFLDELSFEYDSGYGGQELFGTIWFVDLSWADRGEYDGSEWWQIQELPTIPEHLA
jgi:hypothetical protein